MHRYRKTRRPIQEVLWWHFSVVMLQTSFLKSQMKKSWRCVSNHCTSCFLKRSQTNTTSIWFTFTDTGSLSAVRDCVGEAGRAGSPRIYLPLVSFILVWSTTESKNWQGFLWLAETQRRHATRLTAWPICFLTLINDLKACVTVHKFVDDTTLSETIVSKSDTSVMQHAADEICGWSYDNKVNINTKKTK